MPRDSESCCVSGLKQHSDLELMQMIGKRDESALDEIIRRYAGQVRRICQRICFDESEATSLVYEVFWQLWRRSNQFNPDRGSVRTFLLLMARSRSIDRRRSQVARERAHGNFVRQVHSDDHEAACYNAVSAVNKLEEASEIQTALARLPEKQRDAIELAFFKGYTHEQVSKELDVPLGTIKTRIRSGLIQLRSALGRLGAAEDGV